MKRVWFSALFVLAVVAGFAGLFLWSPALVLNTLASGSDVAIERDIAFGPDPRLKLDVYRPQTGGASAPVVVFFYGGSWQHGEKSVYRFLGASLARAGFVVVVPDYRIYPPVIFPEFLKDSALAVRWAKDNAARFGGDPEKLFLAGHSAGAYNAAMLTLDRRWLADAGLDPRRDLRGAIGIAGPYDFLPLESPELKIIFGPEETRAATQPIFYADGKAPPFLLQRPRHDRVVDPGNSARLAARIEANGGEAEVKTYDRLRHLSIIGAFSPLLSFLAPVRADFIAFVRGRSVRPPG